MKLKELITISVKWVKSMALVFGVWFTGTIFTPIVKGHEIAGMILATTLLAVGVIGIFCIWWGLWFDDEKEEPEQRYVSSPVHDPVLSVYKQIAKEEQKRLLRELHVQLLRDAGETREQIEMKTGEDAAFIDEALRKKEKVRR